MYLTTILDAKNIISLQKNKEFYRNNALYPAKAIKAVDTEPFFGGSVTTVNLFL